MNHKLAQKCYEALRNGQHWTERTKENDRTISNLICPECGDRSAWAMKPEPFSINCNKANTCGARTKTRELYNITIDIEREYPETKADPHRPAREYLKSRGLNDDTLKGLDFRYWKKTREGVKTGAVMFPIAKGDNGKECFNGRLINPQGTTVKGHNFGSTSGKYWTHPGRPLDILKPVAITEGIINALSLIQMGCQAIAVLSAGQDPLKLKCLEQYQLVTAFDTDQAGIKATKKYLNVFPNSRAIFTDKMGQDWNDILQLNPKTAKERFKENEKRYEQNAKINLSQNAYEYARLYHEYFNRPPGAFTFEGCTWFSELRVRGENPAPKTERVGLFTLDTLSHINTGNESRKEFLFQLRVKPYKGKPIDCVAPPKSLTSVKDFNTFLLAAAKCNFEGKANALSAMATQITTAKVPEVRQAEHVGFDTISKAYIFNNYMIDPKGKVHFKDKNGFFKIGANERITPAPQAADKAIEPAITPKVNPGQICELIHGAWGYNGLIAFAYAITSAFCNQIKDKIGFMPYLDLSGKPASGKTALLTKLQNLQGRDEEGENISEASTKKGTARKIYGASGMFFALTEFTEENEKSLGFVNLLSAYNRGGGSMVQARFTNNLETKENPLLCSLVFCQNIAPWRDQQTRQRAVSLDFKTEDISATTRQTYETLNNLPKEDIATVMLEVLKRRNIFEKEWHDRYNIARADLEAIPTERIRCNHALILCFFRLFCEVFGIKHDIFTHLEAVALEKEKTSAELNTNDASIFFEQVFSSKSEQRNKYWHEIEEATPRHHETNVLYFSLTEMIRVLQNEGLQPPRTKELMEAIKRHPAYLSNSTNHRYPAPIENNSQGPNSIQRKSIKLDLAKFRNAEDPPQQERPEAVYR